MTMRFPGRKFAVPKLRSGELLGSSGPSLIQAQSEVEVCPEWSLRCHSLRSLLIWLARFLGVLGVSVLTKRATHGRHSLLKSPNQLPVIGLRCCRDLSRNISEMLIAGSILSASSVLLAGSMEML